MAEIPQSATFIHGVYINTDYSDGTCLRYDSATGRFTHWTPNHNDLSNKGTTSHANLDTHYADSTVHFTEASIDHTAITNIGTNTHAQIDTAVTNSTNHIAAANPHSGSASTSDLTTHTSAAAPHSGHEATANKGSASGYCGLDGSGLVDGDDLPAPTTSKKGGVPALETSGTLFLYRDGSWQEPPGASGGEANTMSSNGGGVSIYDTKVAADLQLNSLNTTEFSLASNLISLGQAFARETVGGRIDLSSATVLTWAAVDGLGIGIYNGTTWQLIIPSTAPTIANTANDLDSNPLAVDEVYDLFAEYDTATNFNIVAKKWTNTTTRWGSLYQHQGVYVHENTAAGLKRRFLATIYCYNNAATVNFKDEVNYRYLSNYYNMKRKTVICQNNTSGAWTYSSTTIRESKAGDNQIRGQFVCCAAQNRIAFGKWMITSSVSGAAMTGCGFNSTTALTGNWAWTPASNTQRQISFYAPLTIAAGYNYITTVEKSDAGTASFESSSGAQGALYLELEA